MNENIKKCDQHLPLNDLLKAKSSSMSISQRGRPAIINQSECSLISVLHIDSRPSHQSRDAPV